MSSRGKNRIAFIGLSLLSLQFLFAQSSTGNFYILAAEYEEGRNININQSIVRYDFENGMLARTEKLMSASTKKRGTQEEFVRLDVGTPQFYRDRYVIAGNGPVIDLQAAKVICGEKAQFVAFSGDSIIYYTNDSVKGKYYSYFDLAKNMYYKISDPSYKVMTVKPVEVDQSASPARIIYFPAGAEKKVLVKDAGSPPMKASIPLYWLDNDNFIYPNYGKDQVTLYRINIKKGREKIAFVKSGVLTDPSIAPRFYRNGGGELVFEQAPLTKYVIDVKEHTMLLQESENVGNGFSVSLTEYVNSGRSIKYKGEEIGNYYCDFRKSKTAPGVLAVPFEIFMKNERYGQGMMVWMAASKKWKNVDNPNIMGIIAIIEK
jgi:hypothetical protein